MKEDFIHSLHDVTPALVHVDILKFITIKMEKPTVQMTIFTGVLLPGFLAQRNSIAPLMGLRH